MRKRNTLTKLLCVMRKNGFLRRKTSVNHAIRIRVSYTITPERKLSYNEIAIHIHESVNIISPIN